MIPIDAIRLAEVLSGRFRLDLSGEVTHSGSTTIAAVRAADLPRPNGFRIEAGTGWKSIEAVFAPDNFAGALIRAMGEAPAQAKEQFLALWQTYANLGNRLELRINDSVYSAEDGLPDKDWRRFELKVRQLADLESVDGHAMQSRAEEVCATCLSLVLSLLPLEEESDAPLFESGLPEGARVRVTVNRYERNPVNRASCIAIHGTRCKACDFDFEETYGSLGAGYIEIHHRTPISQLGEDYRINPAEDLVPLCSNCHSAVHRNEPPFDVEMLQKLISARKKQK